MADDLEAQLAGLSAKERTLLSNILKERAEKGSSDTFYRLLAAKYEEVPVDMMTFLESPQYLALGGMLYPRVADLLVECDDPSVREFSLVLGKGSGKSAICSVMMARMVYRLLCYKDPHRELRLMPGSNITIANMSINEEQARNIIFAEFLSRVENSPWFMSGRYRFEPHLKHADFSKSIAVRAGNSSPKWALGYNTICAICDEANYFLEDQSGGQAVEEVVRALRGSLTTRFPDQFKLGVISSARTHEDYLSKRVEYVAETGQEKPWELLGQGCRTLGY